MINKIIRIILVLCFIASVIAGFVTGFQEKPNDEVMKYFISQSVMFCLYAVLLGIEKINLNSGLLQKVHDSEPEGIRKMMRTVIFIFSVVCSFLFVILALAGSFVSFGFILVAVIGFFTTYFLNEELE